MKHKHHHFSPFASTDKKPWLLPFAVFPSYFLVSSLLRFLFPSFFFRTVHARTTVTQGKMLLEPIPET
jgi:hypothetical protein